MSIEAPVSDYRNVRGIKLFPDMIPVVGVVTWAERGRREARMSIKDYYLPILDWKTIVYLGTQYWPRQDAKDWREVGRAHLLAVRNMSFAAWHAFSPLAISLGIQKAVNLISS